MPCYTPLIGFYSAEVNPTGKRSIVFDSRKAVHDLRGFPIKLEVPCGQCIGCRLERSRQWAVRCVHEASLYDKNCFITLTYDDDHVPGNGSLVKSDFQKFMKRLRKKFGKGVRYYECGEYGEKLQRPHYHACLFNFDFPDKELWSIRGGVSLYRSRLLEEVWPFGFATVGDVTFESAAYVARYCTKKITGERSVGYYKGRVPEFVTMSRRPGIGFDWYRAFRSDVYPDDFVVIRDGIKVKPPKYYDSLYDVEHHKVLQDMKYERRLKAESNPHNNYCRLSVRHALQKLKAKQLIRSYEND